MERGRNDAHGIAYLETRHLLTHRLKGACNLETETGRQRRRFEVVAGTHERLGPIQPQYLRTDLNLIVAGLGNLHLLDAQNFRTTQRMKANSACHTQLQNNWFEFSIQPPPGWINGGKIRQ
jgi:hypothetical protein